MYETQFYRLLLSIRTYKRARVKGNTDCLTLALAEQCGNNLLIHGMSVLRTAFRRTMAITPNIPFAAWPPARLPES